MILFKKYYVRKLSKFTTAVLAASLVIQNVFFGVYAIAIEGNIVEYLPRTVASVDDERGGLYWHKISNALENNLPYTALANTFTVENSALLSTSQELPVAPVEIEDKDKSEGAGGGKTAEVGSQLENQNNEEVGVDESPKQDSAEVPDTISPDEEQNDLEDVPAVAENTSNENNENQELESIPDVETPVDEPVAEEVSEGQEESVSVDIPREEPEAPAGEPEAPAMPPSEIESPTSWVREALFASRIVGEVHAQEATEEGADVFLAPEKDMVTSSLVFSDFDGGEASTTLKNLKIKVSLVANMMSGATLTAYYSFGGNSWDKTDAVSLDTGLDNQVSGDYVYIAIPKVPVDVSIQDLVIRLEYTAPIAVLENSDEILLYIDSLSVVEDKGPVARIKRKIEELISPEYVEFTDARTPEELKNARIQYANDIFELLKDTATDEPFQILSKEFDNQTPLELSLMGASADARALYQDGKVTYVDVYQNTDFIYTPTRTGLKEEILLKNEEHPSLFTYSLNLSDFDYEQTADNVIDVYQKGFAGNPLKKLYEITAPYMEDANGVRNENIVFTIVGDELRLIPDPEFLAQATYPVLVDPTITISVLTVYAHPLSGEDWTVDFATVGTSDLRIVPRTETTIHDISFTSLVCDGEERTPQILDNEVVYYQDWSCDGVGTVVHHVEQEGSHILDFEFGGDGEEVVTSTAFNGTYTWDGGGATNNWSECANWSANTCPTTADAVVFDGTSTKNATLDNATTVTSMTISSGYTGTITQGNNNLTITGAFSQADGIFTGGAATTTVGSSFTISGGTFNAPSTTNLATGGISSTLNINSSQTFENLIFDYTNTAQGVTISSGDTLVVTGTLTFDDGFVNGGTINAQGDIVQNAASGGGTTAVNFASAGAQTWTVNGGTGPVPTLDAAEDASDSIVFAAAGGFGGFTVTAGFSGTIPISNSSNYTISFGTGTYSQAAGTWPSGAWNMSLTGDFTLTGGTFNGGTGTMTHNAGGTVSLTGGTFNAPTTFEFSGFSVSTALNVNVTQTFNNLRFNETNTAQGVTISSGDTLVVTGTTTLQDGFINTGTIEARGDVVVSSTFGGGTSPLVFTGTSTSGKTNQTLDLTGATGLFDADVTINKTEGEVQLLSDLVMNASSQDLSIATGTLNINGKNLTVNGTSGTFSVGGAGTFKLQGAETVTANTGYPTFATGATALYVGDGDGIVDSFIPYQYSYYNFVASTTDAGDIINASSTQIDLGGSFTLNGGTFIAPSTTLYVAGDFTNSGGTFTHNSGTTTFDGTSQTIYGDTTFYNLSKTVSSDDTLTFEAGSTQTIAGNLTLAGTDGLLSDDVLSLRSTSGGTQWRIDPQGNRSVSYLDVRDSNNINATAIDAGNNNNTNSGNNTNWTFDPTFTQSQYQFFANVDSLTPGSSLGSQSATTTLTSTSSPVRLRMNIIADTFFATSSAQFKLQVATSVVGIWYTLNPQSDWWNTDFTNRRKIYLDNTASAENLTDFPLLVELNSSRIDYSKTQNSGQDIRFVDSDNSTELNYEIEVWNESGTSTVWVKVPQINAGSDNTDYIWMYYNNAGATDNATTTGVWNSGFQGVWHLSDGSTLDVSDSAKETPTTNVNATAVAGEVDGGADFSSDYIYATDKDGFKPAQNITISAWINPDSRPAWGKIFAKDYRADGTWTSPYLSYELTASNNTSGIPFWTINIGGTAYGTVAPSALTNGTWNQVTGTYDGSVIRLYVNGTEVSSTTQAGSINYPVTADIAIGGRSRYSPGDYLDGKLDEIRFSNTTRSADWIEAEYVSVRDNMNTFASEETASTPSDIWTLTGNASATDGAELPSLLLSSSNIAGTYAEANPTATNPNAATAGQYIEFDFTLDPSNMIVDTYYYFRLIFSNGTTLGSYSSYPTLAVLSNQSPGTPSSLGPSGLTDGSWTTDNTPGLTFTTSDADGDNVQYHILIDDSSDFSSPLVDYTSASGSAGASTFTVGQAAGSGTYTVGSSGQTLSDSSGYYWRVSTTDSNGGTSATTTANSGSIAFKVDATAPTAGTVTLSATSTSGITLTTTAGSDATSGLAATPYNFSNTTTGEYSGATSSLTWSPTGLTPNTQYTFAVSVTDVAGNAATSSTISGYTLANVPASLSASADSSIAITTSWSANSNAAGTEYYVENVTLGTASGWTTSTSYSFTGLTCDTTYEFKVKARNGDGIETSYTATVSVATDACTPQGGGGSSQPSPGGRNSNGQGNSGGGGGGSCLAHMVPTGESVEVDFSQSIQKSWERSFTQILIDNGYRNPQKILSSQSPYEQWGVSDFTAVNFDVKLLAHEGAYHSTFGYYDAGKPHTFVPIGKTGNIFGFATVPTIPVGGSTSFALNASHDSFGMSIRAYSGNLFAGQFYTEDKLNMYGGDNQTAIFKVDDGYVIGFEDLPVSRGGDKDYNDVVLLVRPVACSYYEPVDQNEPPAENNDIYRIFINNDQETTTRGDVFVGFDVPGTVKQVALSNNTGFGGADRIALPLVYSWNICNRGSSRNAKNTCKAGEYTVFARFYDNEGKFLGGASDSIEFVTNIVPPPVPPVPPTTTTTTPPGGTETGGGTGTVIEEVIGGVTGGVETIVETITEAVTATGGFIEGVFASVSTYVAETEVTAGFQTVASSTQGVARQALQSIPVSEKTITASAVLGTVLVAPAAMFARVIGVAMSTANNVGHTADVGLIVWRFMNHIQELFGLRKKRNRWGVVYDARDKMPLHPITVELISMKTHKVVETAITDHAGGYGFLPRDGVFALNVKHPAYTFPSHVVTRGPDGVFAEIYTGKALTLTKEHEPHDLNIPIDKLSEQIIERKRFAFFGLGMKRVGTVIVEAIFWLTFAFMTATFFAEPNLLHGFLVLFYIAIIGIKHSQVEYHTHRYWGHVIAENYQSEIENGHMYIEVSDALDLNDVPKQTRINTHGKFYFKTDKPGTFDVVVKIIVDNKEQILEREKLVVGDDRLITHTLRIV